MKPVLARKHLVTTSCTAPNGKLGLSATRTEGYLTAHGELYRAFSACQILPNHSPLPSNESVYPFKNIQTHTSRTKSYNLRPKQRLYLTHGQQLLCNEIHIYPKHYWIQWHNSCVFINDVHVDSVQMDAILSSIRIQIMMVWNIQPMSNRWRRVVEDTITSDISFKDFDSLQRWRY